jgi:hypothetical protein
MINQITLKTRMIHAPCTTQTNQNLFSRKVGGELAHYPQIIDKWKKLMWL